MRPRRSGSHARSLRRVRGPATAIPLAVLLSATATIGAVACDDDDSPDDSPAGSLGTIPIASTPGVSLEPGSNISTPTPPTATDVTPPSGAATTLSD
jgi:hypothetical protein